MLAGCHAFEASWALQTPWLSPTLSPRRAEKGANSPIWPCVLRGQVQGGWPTGRLGFDVAIVDSCALAQAGCRSVLTFHFTKRSDVLGQAQVSASQQQQQQQQPAVALNAVTQKRWPNRAVSSLFRPAGRERAGGESGGKLRQSKNDAIFSVAANALNIRANGSFESKINRYLTPINSLNAAMCWVKRKCRQASNSSSNQPWR